VGIRLEKHQWHIRLEHTDKSAVAEHSIDQEHPIQFHNSSILATKTRYMNRIVREAIEIGLHPYNIDTRGRLCLSKSWKPLIGSLKLSGYDPGALGDAVPTISSTLALFSVSPFPLHQGHEVSLCM
jgi:hypothetical protein